jgi:hypothetical protein
MTTTPDRGRVPDPGPSPYRTDCRERRLANRRVPRRDLADADHRRVARRARILRARAGDSRAPLRRLHEPADDPRRRLHPRGRVRGNRDHEATGAGAASRGPRPLDRPRPEPGRTAARPPRERPRRRPQPELRLGMAEERTPVGSGVLGTATLVRAGDAACPAARSPGAAGRDDLVPPAAGGRPRLGRQARGGAALRSPRRRAVPLHSLAERDGPQLAESHVPGRRVVRRRASGGKPLRRSGRTTRPRGPSSPPAPGRRTRRPRGDRSRPPQCL